MYWLNMRMNAKRKGACMCNKFPEFPGVPDEPYTKPCCVVRPWVFDLSFKQQTVLLTALRGVDGKEKQDMSKNLCKAMRMSILQNAAPGKGTFMVLSVPEGFVDTFVENIDHYPVHWVLHFMHAAEIIGYKCPHESVRQWWHGFYRKMVDAMHLRPEEESQLDTRLSDII